MHDKTNSLNAIMSEIFSRTNPSLSEEKGVKVRELIDTTINGDTPEAHLTIDANLTKNNLGVIVYILTNVRLIKIDIDAQEIKSSSFILDKIIGVDRRLINEDKVEILVTFEGGSFGLRYPSKNKDITGFFQKVEQHRIKGVS